MAKAEATDEELDSKIERGELRLQEMQRHHVWRCTYVLVLLESPYRGQPSGAILISFINFHQRSTTDQPGRRTARSSGTRNTSRRPSLPAISSPRSASFCRSLRAV
jgi:hypothetical protein